ncbi:flagellar hook-basal body complex protein [Liquorilactobacillus vini]|uniref:Flagellar hook protein FlgE n=1 Tax=Liquorilactobacillus vini DSM 20605 TaxID=1133569 RepID=A0A0A7RGW8_9LACO|nr:flagellar hook-basal body complex protein [Liquorilactobacillus vini]AJA34496.1 flagellar hook protein FlgE [Liquorilactobacillus vini DSM 20605]KRM82586.1 flagellar hook protein flgE [Liquorilactobacillus vini DSM 20605]
MLRSLYSGVSGLKSFQTDLDVVANNIANVNTVGYKSSRVIFQDLVSQTLSNATAPSTTSGGINAEQIGLGTKVGSIDTDTSTGSPESTDSSLDFYINGNGYFAVQEGSGTDAKTYYTRVGAFERDSSGNLVTTSDGLKVLGWTETPTAYTGSNTVNTSGDPGTINVPDEVNGSEYSAGSLAIDENGTITATYGSTKYVLGQLAFATFNNPEGLQKVGGSDFEVSANSGAANYTTAGNNGVGTLISGELEMSNVDLSSEFTEMIIANRAYQANAKVITTSDDILQVLTNLKQS